MPLGTILIIIAAILVVVGLAMGYPGEANPGPRYRRSYFVLGISVLLICIALCIGVEPFIRT